MQVNGVRVPADLVGIARPVNPGPYHVTATTAGNRTAAVDIELKKGEAKSVELCLNR